VVIFFKVSNWHNPIYSPFDPTSWSTEIDFTLVYYLAFFAFIQNLAREILKDIEDMKGDELIYVKSLPMAIGVEKSFGIVKLLLLVFPTFAFFTGVYHLNELITQPLRTTLTVLIPYLVVILLNILVIYLIKRTEGSKLALYHNLIKVSMLFGVLSTFYFAFVQ
jgi:4-hydroxybenzoate polyprenyltransferase